MRSANLQCFSNGESWAGLEYMFWIQRSHGRSAGTKLCNYIAADRLSYQYVCYENFEISGWKEQYAIRKIGQFLLVSFTDYLDRMFRTHNLVKI